MACAMQPASAQRGVLFDVGVMERVMHGSLVRARQAGDSSMAHTSRHSAGDGESHGSPQLMQKMRPVSSRHMGSAGDDMNGRDSLGGRTTRDFTSRQAEIQARYDDLASRKREVDTGCGSGGGNAGVGDGMLDVAAQNNLAITGRAHQVHRRQSRSAGAEAHVRTDPVRNIRQTQVLGM